MAWDLWSSSCDQAASGGGNYSQHNVWQCDFYFGCGHDAIEEDALNEESCVRVLRILITKADSEIEELEKDLLSLQNELAWAEHEKWPDICCSALIERINRLDVAVSTLKNYHAGDAEMQLLLRGEPAETLHEIVKALRRDHCQDTLGQLRMRRERVKSPVETGCKHDIIIQRDTLLINKRLNCTHLDMSILNPFGGVTEHDLDKDSSSIDSNIIIKEEAKEFCGTSENSGSSELLSELHEKRSDNPKMIEEFHEESLARSPDLGAISCAPDQSDGVELSETSDNILNGNEEITRSQLITTDTGQILNLFSAKGNGNIPSEAKENEIVKEKDFTSDDLRLETDVKGRKKNLHSRLGTSKHRKSGNSDLDKKLCDFAPKSARRASKKESKVALEEDLDPVNLPLQVVYPRKWCIADTEFCSLKGSNGNSSGQVINIENATLIHAENSALVSLLGMQTKSAVYGLQLTDEEKPQAQGLESEITANLSKSNMSFPTKLKAQGKQKPELNTLAAGEPRESCTEVLPSSSIVVSTKRQRKSKPSTDDAILNESMNRKITKRAVQPGQHETEGRSIVLYDSKFSELQKKRRVSKLPITVEIQNSTVNMDVPNSDRSSMDNASQVDLHISKSYSLVDSHNGTSSLLPITLKSLTLSDLRAMAKQHNVRKYYKLAKGALVEQLVERLSSC
ncbi:uncharacterized protein LOC113861911 [Abrus precatorius]|uniref:Uncharacterized protein LOC113861911 n=1 Tax=Abrus precatorius TaxID=3816 RepID=A0A8B8L3G2_ABRPR|nr:uncharacterized protein LOC113861911 [Abrus precatorius]